MNTDNASPDTTGSIPIEREDHLVVEVPLDLRAGFGDCLVEREQWPPPP